MPPLVAPIVCSLAIAHAWFAPGARAQTCPENTIWHGCYDLVGSVSSSPSFTYEGGAWLVGAPCPTGCYNLPFATFSAHGVGTPWSECGTDMVVGDSYRVGGLPPGPPIPFYAELHVAGTITGNANLRARLTEDGAAGESDARSEGAVGNPSFVLRVPMTHAPGESFSVRVYLGAFGAFPAGDSQAQGELLFSGLPAGAWIESCQNYDRPVPAGARSWGALKAAYR